jgi:hypothetical protein
MSVMDIPVVLSIVNPLYYTAKTAMNSRTECKMYGSWQTDILEEYIVSIFETEHALRKQP